jgi:hypothetical protein
MGRTPAPSLRNHRAQLLPAVDRCGGHSEDLSEQSPHTKPIPPFRPCLLSRVLRLGLLHFGCLLLQHLLRHSPVRRVRIRAPRMKGVNPRHSIFEDRCVRSLFNAFTESLKEGNLAELPKRSQALHGLMDTYVKLNLHA